MSADLTRLVTLRHIHCRECGWPWGVIGSEDGEAELRSDWNDYFADWDNGPAKFPGTYTTCVIQISESGANFINDHLGGEGIEAGWCDVDYLSDWGVPAWWANARKHHGATRIKECGCA